MKRRNTYILGVVHDTSVVVGHTITTDLTGCVSHEVICHSRLDVLCLDVDKTVSVRAGLFMLESNRVTHLMYDDPFLKIKYAG